MNRRHIALVAIVAIVSEFSVLESKIWGQGFATDISADKMSAVDGFKVKLFAAEPNVRQPILVKHDPKGRLWTIQYLQYPNPAGLKRVKVDRWSRTIYDRVPKPPPHGPRGADKITICEDTDGDFVADKFTDFVDGLNLCTSIEFGHGGVYVLQPPYLLFYPDEDQDDVPDADPKVLIAGFGMHDAQSLANHLTWGPDGWLYGVQGSTVTSNIRGIEFQQGVWRYHIQSDSFELYSEGGGNTFGLTFDEVGQLFQSTNGGPFLHVVPGAYFYKSFNKHGPLHNLFTYGYFSHVQRNHMAGGPPTGGTIYQGNGFGREFNGRFIAGDFLGHNIFMWDVDAHGSTVRATDRGTLVRSNDSWFGPTDICIGPDGSLFVSDFHDQRTSHPDPDAKWDRSNGRIYRVSTGETGTPSTPELSAFSTDLLFELATGDDHWLREQARVMLHGRDATSLSGVLAERAGKMLATSNTLGALRALWALNAVDRLTTHDIQLALQHRNDHVKSWAIRLAIDNDLLNPRFWKALEEIAEDTQSPVEATALADAIRRRSEGINLLKPLFANESLVSDSRVPLLVWWAVENRITQAEEAEYLKLANLFSSGDLWKHSLFETTTFRVIRRLAFGSNTTELEVLTKVLKAVPKSHADHARDALRLGISERVNDFATVQQGTLFTDFAEVKGVKEAQIDKPSRSVAVSEILNRLVCEKIEESPDDKAWVEIGLMLGLPIAKELLQASMVNGSPFSEETAVGILLPHLKGGQAVKLASDSIMRSVKANGGLASHQVTFIEVLANENAMNAPDIFLVLYKELQADRQQAIRTAMLSRRDWAIRLLRAIDSNRIPKEHIKAADLRIAAVHDSSELLSLIQKHYGSISAGTKEATLALMRKYNNDLRHSGGEIAAGKTLFKKHCAVCHKLFGEGEKIGPDLTNENRQDRAALLANIVDPSAVIKRDYLASIITTKNGQVLSGIISNRTGDTITLVDTQRKQQTIRTSDVESIMPSSTSLMPVNIMKEFTAEQVRSLFKYLQSSG